PPLPEYLPPEPRRRSYGWLAWSGVFATVFVLAALMAPQSVRQALMQTIRPIFGSTSLGDSRPAAGDSKSAVTTKSAPSAASSSDSQSTAGSAGSSAAASKGLTIVIDPGHGGGEPGARGPNGLLEKSVC